MSSGCFVVVEFRLPHQDRKIFDLKNIPLVCFHSLTVFPHVAHGVPQELTKFAPRAHGVRRRLLKFAPGAHGVLPGPDLTQSAPGTHGVRPGTSKFHPCGPRGPRAPGTPSSWVGTSASCSDVQVCGLCVGIARNFLRDVTLVQNCSVKIVSISDENL